MASSMLLGRRCRRRRSTPTVMLVGRARSKVTVTGNEATPELASAMAPTERHGAGGLAPAWRTPSPAPCPGVAGPVAVRRRSRRPELAAAVAQAPPPGKRPPPGNPAAGEAPRGRARRADRRLLPRATRPTSVASRPSSTVYEPMVHDLDLGRGRSWSSVPVLSVPPAPADRLLGPLPRFDDDLPGPVPLPVRSVPECRCWPALAHGQVDLRHGAGDGCRRAACRRAPRWPRRAGAARRRRWTWSAADLGVGRPGVVVRVEPGLGLGHVGLGLGHRGLELGRVHGGEHVAAATIVAGRDVHRGDRCPRP
jgi:hypothetical protein